MIDRAPATEPFASIYPFERRYFDVGGARMHYLDEGSGPPLLMVHGNPTWSFYYRNLVLALRDRYRVIVPDHVGCGLSDKPSDAEYDYTLERRVADLSALVDHLDLGESISLIVHDWGGMIGMGWAIERPERIARLVAMNTAAFHLPAGLSLPWSLRLCRSPLGSFLVRGLNLFSRGAQKSCVRQHTFNDAERSGYLDVYDNWANRIAVHRFVQDIPLVEGDRAFALVSRVEERLPEFASTPALIFWGAHDFVFNDDFLAEWRKRLPHAEVVRFADAGHYVLEDAFDEILPRVTDFLAGPARPTAAR